MFELGVRFSKAYVHYNHHRGRITIGLKYKDEDREKLLESWKRYRDQIDVLYIKAKKDMSIEQETLFMKGTLYSGDNI